MNGRPVFRGLHIFVRDMQATIAFYARLGITVTPAGDGQFARADLGDGLALEFGTPALSRAYDPGWREPSGAGRNALQFGLPSRAAVDELYADLTSAGYHGHLPPFDAYWGSRYAEVDDPDGNIVGLQSPRDDARAGPPPL